jgi:hypothetical protein
MYGQWLRWRFFWLSVLVNSVADYLLVFRHTDSEIVQARHWEHLQVGRNRVVPVVPADHRLSLQETCPRVWAYFLKPLVLPNDPVHYPSGLA